MDRTEDRREALAELRRATRSLHSAAGKLHDRDGLDAHEIRRLRAVLKCGACVRQAGVEAVHDLHVWTITSGFVALSCHVVATGRSRDALLRDVERTLDERFGIGHTTLQVEGPGHPCADSGDVRDESGEPPPRQGHGRNVESGERERDTT